MIWLWLTCFSAVLSAAEPAVFRGRVELKDSREAAVRKRSDFSGVVISLRPVMPGMRVAPSSKHSQILQKDKMFRPHLLAIETGSTVDFPNADPIFHNAFSSYSGQVFDIGLYAPGSSRSVRFARPGVVRVFCNIHAAMSAVIVVLDTPYFAVTGPDGSYAINAPAGAYELRVYHERATEEELRSHSRTVQLTASQEAQPPIVISEAGYLPSPHKNKHGQDYGTIAGDESVYPGVRR